MPLADHLRVNLRSSILMSKIMGYFLCGATRLSSSSLDFGFAVVQEADGSACEGGTERTVQRSLLLKVSSTLFNTGV